MAFLNKKCKHEFIVVPVVSTAQMKAFCGKCGLVVDESFNMKVTNTQVKIKPPTWKDWFKEAKKTGEYKVK